MHDLFPHWPRFWIEVYQLRLQDYRHPLQIVFITGTYPRTLNYQQGDTLLSKLLCKSDVCKSYFILYLKDLIYEMITIISTFNTKLQRISWFILLTIATHSPQRPLSSLPLHRMLDVLRLQQTLNNYLTTRLASIRLSAYRF